MAHPCVMVRLNGSMADPTIQTFCCHNGHFKTDMAVKVMDEFNTSSYNLVCLCSSFIGMMGALYQIYPKKDPYNSTRNISFNSRGRNIIIWLAVADLLASLGVFVRSIVWMNFKRLIDVPNDTSNVMFCAISSAWTQYFYTATWLWTLFYAIDVYLALKERDSYSQYHAIAWGLPAILTATGLSILYIPNAECHNIKSIDVALLRVLPNYCATYIPIATVMIANPIIYYMSAKNVVLAVSRQSSQITNRERYLAQNIKFKFAMINVVFYCCWLPNLINGVLLWTLWFNLPTKIIIGFWYFMAVMNPLQALFNAIIYRRWTPSWNLKSMSLTCCLHKKNYEPNTHTPLLSPPPPSRLHLSGSLRNNSINMASSI